MISLALKKGLDFTKCQIRKQAIADDELKSTLESTTEKNLIIFPN